MSEAENKNSSTNFEFSLGISDNSKYMLHSRSEIASIIRSFIAKNAMITVHIDNGNHFFLTSILAIDPEKGRLIIDVSGEETMNRRVLDSNKLIFTTFIDKVKIQFSLNGVSDARFEGGRAFSGALPEKLLRLQRRDFFRLTIPVAAPVRCSLSIPRSANLDPVSLDIPLWDISGGGLGLVATPEQSVNFQSGDIVEDCKILLPEEGVLIASLCIRNMFEVTSKNGTRMVRIGCEFHKIPTSRLNVVQRYITRIERERKARLSGLG